MANSGDSIADHCIAGPFVCRNCGADGPGSFVWARYRNGTRKRRCVSCRSARPEEARGGCALRAQADPSVSRVPDVATDPLFAVLMGAEDGAPRLARQQATEEAPAPRYFE